MPGELPLVSVIIPTYNTAQYIAEAVESALAQTYPNLEIIVVDDGSTDNTRDVLAPYQVRQYGSKTFCYIWQENQERAHTRNNGIRQAQGEWIAFLDSDDIWQPDKIALQMAALQAHPEAVLAYGVALNVTMERQPVKFWGSIYSCGQPDPSGTAQPQVQQPGSEMLYGTPLMPSVVIANRTAMLEVGLFDPQATPVEDWELWLRLARLGTFIFIPQVVCEYRAFSTERELKKRATDHNLERWLYVVQKAAANDPFRYPPDLVAQVIGNLHARSALASYELGDQERGAAQLSRAIQVDPQLGDALRFSHLLEDHVRRMVDENESPQIAHRFLANVIHHLPPQAPKGLQSRAVLSRVYMAIAFQTDNKTTQLRNTLWQGLRADPRWLFNRGVLVLLLKSFAPNPAPTSE
jgi:glycosyltransferase involved in cell wall biosynthesis